MAPPTRSYALIITLLFIFFLSILPSKSGEFVMLKRNESLEERKMVIGSKPPDCLKKCMNCRPCIATLVVPNNQNIDKGTLNVSSRGDEDDTYYLLAWKCRCGNKIFQP